MEPILNPIESVLRIYNKYGCSTKKIMEMTGFSKRTIKYYIYNSKFIEDTGPLLHGSGKAKNDVYNYTDKEQSYFKRKIKSTALPVKFI